MCRFFEFFTEKTFLQNIVSALIGTGTALYIYYLTLESEKKKEKKKEENNNKNIIRNLTNLVSSSIEHANKTISNLNKMIDSYNQDPIQFQLLRYNPDKSFERLDENLKNESYFQAFYKIYGKKNINEFNNISLIIDYFNLQINSLWKMIEKAQLSDYNRKQIFVNSSNNIIDEIAKLLYYPPKSFEKIDEERVNQFLIDYYKNLNIEDLNYNYIYIRKAIEEVFKNHIHNPDFLEIISEIKKASILFNEIKLHNEFHKNELIEIKNQMQKSLNNYVNIIKKLN